VLPGQVFLGRTQEVLVSGSGTQWSSSTTVDFGPGITIDRLTVASPSALSATITVAPGAALGPRDLTVSDLPYRMTFSVAAPIRTSYLGSLAQGSIVRMRIDNLDLAHLFDTTSVGDGLFSTQTFPNIKVATPPGTFTAIADVTPFAVEVQAFIDVDAPATASDVDLSSGSANAQVRSIDPGGFAPAARTALPLPVGATDASLAAPFETALYTFTPTAGPHVTVLTAADNHPETETLVLLLPKSGRWSENFGAGGARRWLGTDGSDPFFAVLWDADAGAPSSYTLTRAELPATRVSEAAEPANDFASAVPIASLPAVIIGATLSGAGDQDWFSFNVPAGKRMRVVTHGGDVRTDTAVSFFGPDGTTLVGIEIDNNFHENLVSAPVPVGGTHYVKIAASTMFDAQHARYDAVLLLE
jgi:hypothetical protein